MWMPLPLMLSFNANLKLGIKFSIENLFAPTESSKTPSTRTLYKGILNINGPFGILFSRNKVYIKHLCFLWPEKIFTLHMWENRKHPKIVKKNVSLLRWENSCLWIKYWIILENDFPFSDLHRLLCKALKLNKFHLRPFQHDLMINESIDFHPNSFARFLVFFVFCQCNLN